jgi:signal recognition particle receptor subunit beta
MVFAPSDGQADSMLAAFKIVVAGGFGAGKTTLVGAVSEVQPLRTEESLSRAGLGLDDRAGVEDKTTTTVAMDFGRITINEHLILYLFGTPGQERFWFMWDELSYGAIGAVILADTRRLSDCFPSVDYFEKCGLPFVIALNSFGDSPQYDPEDVRAALDLGPHIPVMYCDARKSSSVKQVLITLVENVLATSPPPPRTQPVAAAPPPAVPHTGKATDFFSAPTPPAAPAPHTPAPHAPAPHPHTAEERWPAAAGHHKH